MTTFSERRLRAHESFLPSDCTGILGDKRIGFLAMVTFLGLTGYHFEAVDADVVATILALAEGQLSEEALADWIRQRCSKQP